MGMPDVDETEVKAGTEAILREYGNVIASGAARNIAYFVLVAARSAKCDAETVKSKR